MTVDRDDICSHLCAPRALNDVLRSCSQILLPCRYGNGGHCHPIGRAVLLCVSSDQKAGQIVFDKGDICCHAALTCGFRHCGFQRG